MIRLHPDVTIEFEDTQRFEAEGWSFATVTARVENPDGTGVPEVRALVQVRLTPQTTLAQARSGARDAALALMDAAAEKLRQTAV